MQPNMNELRQEALKRITENDYTVFGNLDELEIPSPPDAQVRRKQPSDITLVPHQVPKQKLKLIHHGSPTVPVEVDGKDIDPSEIRQYDGKPLYSTVRSIGKPGQSQLVSFTDPDRAVDFIRGMVKSEDHPGTDLSGFFGSHVQPTYPSYFFEHINFGGARIDLEDRHTFWDLRDYWLGGILWWWTSWNDQISSLITTGRGVVLYENIWWGGSSLYLPPNSLILFLGNYGWNDRTSSVRTDY